jgi:hypothetical protein
MPARSTGGGGGAFGLWKVERRSVCALKLARSDLCDGADAGICVARECTAVSQVLGEALAELDKVLHAA